MKQIFKKNKTLIWIIVILVLAVGFYSNWEDVVRGFKDGHDFFNKLPKSNS